MKKVFLASCAFAALTSVSWAQSSTTQPPMGADRPATTQAPMGAQTAPGVQRVDAASLVMTYYTANPADMRVSRLMGRNVQNLNNETIGEVNDIIIDNGKTIKAIVVGVGGFLGIGERNVAIAPSALILSELGDGTARLVVNTTRDDLKNAQAFNFADVDKSGPGAGATTGTTKPPAANR